MLAAEAFKALHLFVLAAFLACTTLLLALALVRRLRVRRAVLAWRDRGRLRGAIPPAAFLAAVVGCAVWAAWGGTPLAAWLLTAYAVGGVCWLGAAVAHAVVSVTPYGVVVGAVYRPRSMAWQHACDYFVHDEKGGAQRYVFLLHTEAGRDRFEVTVPAAHADTFGEIVRAQVDARFEYPARRTYGAGALKRQVRW